MQTYALFVTNTGKQILSRQSDLSLLEWKSEIEKRILKMTSKTEYYEDIQKGNVIAGWSDYDECVKSMSETDVQLVLGGYEEGVRFLLVRQNKELGIIAREGGQTKVIKGDIKLFVPYKIVKQKYFNELQMFNKKDEKLLMTWAKEYFNE